MAYRNGLNLKRDPELRYRSLDTRLCHIHRTFPWHEKSVGGAAPPTCYDAGVRRVAMSASRRGF